MKYTILSSHFCLFQNSLIDLLTSKVSCFTLKKYKMLFYKKKKKGFWTTNSLFWDLSMYFYRLWYLIWSHGCLLRLRLASLGLMFTIDFSSFHNGFKHFCSLKQGSILRAALCKVVMKCKTVMLFHFLGSFSQNIHFWGFKILSHRVSNIQST